MPWIKRKLIHQCHKKFNFVITTAVHNHAIIMSTKKRENHPLLFPLRSTSVAAKADFRLTSGFIVIFLPFPRKKTKVWLTLMSYPFLFLHLGLDERVDGYPGDCNASADTGLSRNLVACNEQGAALMKGDRRERTSRWARMIEVLVLTEYNDGEADHKHTLEHVSDSMCKGCDPLQGVCSQLRS